uniref:Uncharacterized protein n=1 Tax=Zea mays TaxID=4577 RepID=B4FYB3_MAIZE|nr:unknown [Zea mays]
MWHFHDHHSLTHQATMICLHFVVIIIGWVPCCSDVSSSLFFLKKKTSLYSQHNVDRKKHIYLLLTIYWPYSLLGTW